MPRAESNKLYRTFTKGLLTEASPLTYPENAWFEANNCVVFRKGNTTRRLGFNIEPKGELLPLAPDTGLNSSLAHSEFHWKSPGNIAGLNFLCRQIVNHLHFYDMSVVPLCKGHKGFSIDLEPYSIKADPTFGGLKLQYAQGKGLLFVVGQDINPLIITYTPDTISVQTVTVQIRDFKGVDDNLANDQEPTDLTKEHAYNLVNQGWAPPAYIYDPDTPAPSQPDTTYYNPSTGQEGTYPSPGLPEGVPYHGNGSNQPEIE